MQPESDGLRLRMLKSVGACRLTVEGQELWALFVSENEPIDLNGVVFTSHAPLLICRTSDAKRVALSRGQVIEGLPDPLRVKADDGGDRSAICRGQWAGFHTVELQK